MNIIKKTIILNNKNNGNISMLTLIKDKFGTFGTIKIFNFAFPSNSMLGISFNNKTFKQNIAGEKNKDYSFKLNDEYSLNSKIGCVLVDVANSNIVPLVWGQSGNSVDYKYKILESLNHIKSSISTIKNNKDNLNNVESKSDNTETIIANQLDNADNLSTMEELEVVTFSNNSVLEETKNDISKNLNNSLVGEHKNNSVSALENENNEEKVGEDNNLIVKANDTDNIEMEDISNKNVNMANKEDEIIKTKHLFDSTNSEIEKKIDAELIKEPQFYGLISEQIEDLFAKYPRETNLEKLVPNSKWVKVDFENNGHFYVIGLIYENDVLKYVCYGVPGVYSKNPPKDLESYSQWLPLDSSNPQGDGYWVMFQDAESGDSIEFDAI